MKHLTEYLSSLDLRMSTQFYYFVRKAKTKFLIFC